jgi:membrane associated rhomboid family serine protease
MTDAPASDTHYCYRHPDRETLLSCSQCERPICTECMSPAAVGIRCPECAGKAATGMAQATRRRAVRNIARPGQQNTVTITLVVINVLVFLAELAQGVGIQGGGASSIVTKGGLYGPAIANGETWRLITAAFIHASVVHVAFNMWALWILGTAVESYVGPRRMILIYAVSLFWGSAGALLLSPNELTIGASGAIFGLMGALVVMSRQRGIAIMQSGLGAFLLINLVITLFIPGVSIGGHLGGLIGGALAGFVLSGYGRGHIAYSKLSSQIAGGIFGLLLISFAVSLIAAHGGL